MFCPLASNGGEISVSPQGKGAIAEMKEVLIRIPAGIEAGTSLRVRDAGNSGSRGGPRGDLFVDISVKKDPKFRREGGDIFSVEEINYVDAILGSSIRADTIDGKADVKIPSGTQPEQQLRLKGKGVPKLGTDLRGDAFITIRVKIPTSLSGKEKELVEQISDLQKKSSGFFGGFA